MNQQDFKELFGTALEMAAVNAEQRLGYRISRHFRIRLHGAGHPGDLLDARTAAEELYLGDDRFYRIIDVAVVEVNKQSTTIFVRASQHKPVPFEQTWNNPPGNGPFKQLVAMTIKIGDQ